MVGLCCSSGPVRPTGWRPRLSLGISAAATNNKSILACSLDTIAPVDVYVPPGPRGGYRFPSWVRGCHVSTILQVAVLIGVDPKQLLTAIAQATGPAKQAALRLYAACETACVTVTHEALPVVVLPETFFQSCVATIDGLGHQIMSHLGVQDPQPLHLESGNRRFLYNLCCLTMCTA